MDTLIKTEMIDFCRCFDAFFIQQCSSCGFSTSSGINPKLQHLGDKRIVCVSERRSQLQREDLSICVFHSSWMKTALRVLKITPQRG